MKYKQTFAPSRATNTLPNQSLSVQDILERFTRGQQLPLARSSHDDPQGLSDEEHFQLHECEDDFERMDTLIAIEEGRAFNNASKNSKFANEVNSKNKSSGRSIVERSAEPQEDVKSTLSEEADN